MTPRPHPLPLRRSGPAPPAASGGLVPVVGLCVAVASCGGDVMAPVQPETAVEAVVAEATGGLPANDSKRTTPDSVTPSSDSLVLSADTVPAASARSSVNDRRLAGAPLSIADMLADRLFQVSAESVTDRAISDPLEDALSSLAQGQEKRARTLIVKARDAADALLDRVPGSNDTLIAWSVVERYFEEAELL